VQEDLRGLWPVSEGLHTLDLEGRTHASRPPTAAQVDALVRMLVTLHRNDVRHGDLQALHVLLRTRPDASLEAVLIDCDSVRFEARLDEADRVRDLAHLNASLPDDWGTPERRRAAFESYADRCGFERSREAVLRDVVAASLARAQHWTGRGCSPASAVRAPVQRASRQRASGP
jgi:Ser/Thr protein kinase RdoA (MazF antagonist)